ncbi:hypothetical protein [Streptomyces fagopyri]|uniref:hypothetical protein n=1 Tax=Streptomyces fagopyri TaxID=2662397 RepID=UPI003720C897
MAGVIGSLGCARSIAVTLGLLLTLIGTGRPGATPTAPPPTKHAPPAPTAYAWEIQATGLKVRVGVPHVMRRDAGIRSPGEPAPQAMKPTEGKIAGVERLIDRTTGDGIEGPEFTGRCTEVAPGDSLTVTGIGLDEHMTVHDVARQLPAITDLLDHCRALAMLDAILSPEWEDRHYSMNARWAEGEEMASMRNGSGNEYSIVFSTAGVYVRGFDHESPMSPYGNDGRPWPGVIDEVPDRFKSFVREPAFTDEDGVPVVTACLWRGATDDRWHHGTIDFPGRAVDPDGATGLFELLIDRSPEAFQRFAEDYYEVPVDLEAVSQVYALRPLSQQLVSSLNPEVSLTDLAQDISEVGYPRPDQELT